MNPFSFFILLSLFYAWVGLRTLAEAWRHRERLFDDDLGAWDRGMLDRLAFFLLIPLGVLLHELGHAAATLQVGGEVLELRWYLFFGYVLPGGNFSALQHWWIALAGNLVGALIGLAALALLLLPMRPARAYLCWSFARLQLFYSLLFYPIFSAATGFGDWSIIYSASAGPWLWPTLAVHGLLLLGYLALLRLPAIRRWILGRYAPPAPGGWSPAGPSAAASLAGSRHAQPGSPRPPSDLSTLVARDPEGLEEQLELGLYYVEQGEMGLAERSFREAEALDPGDARPLLQRAGLEARRGRHHRALDLFSRALELADGPGQHVQALAGLAEAELEHRRPSQALSHARAALALAPGNPWLQLLRARLLAITGDELAAREDLTRLLASPIEPLRQAAEQELARLS